MVFIIAMADFSGASIRGAWGARTPLILDAKLGPKEPKNFFGDRPRSRPSPYLKVWIRLF